MAGSSSSLDQVPLTVGSLFSGIGGMDLGLHRAGMDHAFFCEWERDRRVVLRRHWPEVPVHDDVRTLRGDDDGEHGAAIDGLAGEPAERPRDLLGDDRWLLLDGVQAPDVDLLAGGFPCQDLSVAGRRRGLAGARSGLFFQFMRLADDLVRPGGFVLIENVPGLFSSQNGRDFAIVLATLAELGFHDLAWRVLDSRHFGVPQRRRRVFILARRARGRLCAEVLLESEGSSGDHAPGDEARPRSADGAGGGSRAPGVAAPLTAGGHERGVSAPGRRKEDDENLVADTLRANGGRDSTGKRGNRTDQQPLTVLRDDVPEETAALTGGDWREGGAGPHRLDDHAVHGGQVIPDRKDEEGRAWAIDETPHGDSGPSVNEGETGTLHTRGDRIFAAQETSALTGGMTPDGPRSSASRLDSHAVDGGQLIAEERVVPALTGKGNQQDDQESQQLVTTAQGDEVTHSLTSEGHDGSEDGTGRGTPMAVFDPTSGGEGSDTETVPNLRSGGARGEGGTHPEGSPGFAGDTVPIAFGHTNADPARDASEADAPAVRSGGEGTGSGGPAVCIHGDALGRSGDAETPSRDAEGHVRKRPPGMGVKEDESYGLNASQPHAVAFTQNQRDEVRELEDASSLSGQGTHQTTYLAQEKPELETYAKRHNAEDADSEETWDESDYARTLADRGTPTEAAVDRARSMVRRLTPTECERLQGLPDGWTAPFGPRLSDAPSWYELGSARRGQAGRGAASHGETRQGSPPATAVRTSHRGAGGLGVSEDTAHTVEAAGPEAVSFPTGNAMRGDPREGEVSALGKGAGPHGAASHHVYQPEEPVAYDDRNQESSSDEHHTLRADGSRSSDFVSVPDERSVSEQIDDGDLAQSLTTRFGNSGADLPDGEGNWLVPEARMFDASSTHGGEDEGSGVPNMAAPGESLGLTTRADRYAVLADRAAVAAGAACPIDPPPDGPRYAGLGDAVTATVAEWIGSRLAAAVEAERG